MSLIRVAERIRRTCWVAEYRLRTTSWYSYHVTFHGDVDPALQWLMQLLRAQILARGRGDGHVADEEWCAVPRLTADGMLTGRTVRCRHTACGRAASGAV